MDERKRKELGKLLTAIESRRHLDRMAERERGIRRSRSALRFEELKRTAILPTLREFMADLNQRGHITRLREASRERVRLDVQIQSQAARRGAIEFTLDPIDAAKVQVTYGWGWKREQEACLLDQLDAGFVADRVLHLLKGLA